MRALSNRSLEIKSRRALINVVETYKSDLRIEGYTIFDPSGGVFPIANSDTSRSRANHNAIINLH